MGWIRGGKPGVNNAQEKTAKASNDDSYPILSARTPEAELPFIAAEEVTKRNGKDNKRLWIVVDSLVLDPTEYIDSHPGGRTVIESFGGQNCSWQWWTFHGQKEMDEQGKKLRVGRTEGVANQYLEPRKYVGLRSISGEEW